MANDSTHVPSAPRPLGERLLLASLLLGVGDVAGKFLALLITIARTHSLSAAEFGGFGFIISTIGMFAQVSGFSLGMAATRYISLHRHSEHEKARQIAQFIVLFGLATTCLAAVLLLILAPYLTVGLPGLIVPLRWSSLILIFQTLSGLFLGFLAGLEQFRSVTIAVFLQNVVMLALTACLAPLWGLNGTVLAMAAGFAVTFAIAFRQCKELIGGSWATFSQLWSHYRILIDFCIPSLLGGIIIIPASWLSTAIIAAQHEPVEPLLAGMFALPPSWLAVSGLAYLYSSGLRQVGLYTAADQFRPMLSLLSNIVAQPMMPLITAQIHKANDITLSVETRHEALRRTRRGIERCFQLVICLILPAHACFAFAAPYIMALFGRSFSADWNVFLVVLYLGAVGGMVSLNGVALYAQGRVWLQNFFLMVFGFVLVGVTWLLQNWGAYALAFGQLAATFSTFLLAGIILVRLGYFTLHSIGVQLLAMLWMALITITSAWLPEHFRIYSIPLSVGITFFLLFLFLKSETYYVVDLLLRKMKLRK